MKFFLLVLTITPLPLMWCRFLPWCTYPAFLIVARLLWLAVSDRKGSFKASSSSSYSRAEDVQTEFGHQYECESYVCWKCRMPMLVFNWYGHELWDHKLPPDPRPPSVQFRFSKTIGRHYWANTCTNCDAIQGDFFVFCEIDSPSWTLAPLGSGSACDSFNSDDSVGWSVQAAVSNRKSR